MGLLQVMGQGAQMGVVKPENIAEAIKLYVEANEFKNPERFVSPPEPNQGPSPEQVQQGMQALQMQQQQIQELSQENEQLKAQMQNKQADTAIKAQDSQVSAELKAQELALKQREVELKERELEMKAAAEMFKAQTERLASVGVEGMPETMAVNQQNTETLGLMVEALGELIQKMNAPKVKNSRLVRQPDGSYLAQSIEEAQ
jgi:predicted RNase H-like nuclease (RuvC/YqgF family)